MTMLGKHTCTGCDCKNQTEEVSPLLSTTGTGTALRDAPCCDAYPDGTPCRYAIIFQCEHAWPLWMPSSCLTGGVEIGGVMHVPYGVLLNENGEGLCQVPSPLALTFPVMEVLRDCPSDVTGECIYTNRLYYNFIKPSGFQTHMATSLLIDRVTDAAVNKFPPYRVNAGEIEYVKARYGRAYADPNRGPDVDDDDCYHPYDLEFEYSTLWQLKIGGSPASLEWVYDDVLDAIPQFAPVGTGSGPNAHRPRYEAIDAWDLWGRNTMVLQNPEDWPALPRTVCVAPESYGRIVNRCSSHEEQCTCCDIGESTGVIWPTITGCDKLNGTYTGVSQRYVDGDTLPPGVTMPGNAPCGFFWCLIGPDDECDISGTTWSSTIGLMTYCDGTTQHVIPYCYNKDTSQFVEQTEATIITQECTCKGLYFVFELAADLDCCCPPPVDPDCPCADSCLTVTLPGSTVDNCAPGGGGQPCDRVTGVVTLTRNAGGGCYWTNQPLGAPGTTDYVAIQWNSPVAGQWAMFITCDFPVAQFCNARYQSLTCTGTYTKVFGPDGLPATLTVGSC